MEINDTDPLVINLLEEYEKYNDCVRIHLDAKQAKKEALQNLKATRRKLLTQTHGIDTLGLFPSPEENLCRKYAKQAHKAGKGELAEALSVGTGGYGFHDDTTYRIIKWLNRPESEDKQVT